MPSHSIIINGTAQHLNYATDYLGYKENIPDPEDPESTIPNPESRLDFLDSYVLGHLRECAKAGKADEAEVTKRSTVDSYSPSF